MHYGNPTVGDMEVEVDTAGLGGLKYNGLHVTPTD